MCFKDLTSFKGSSITDTVNQWLTEGGVQTPSPPPPPPRYATVCMWFPHIATDFVFVLNIVFFYFLATSTILIVHLLVRITKQ